MKTYIDCIPCFLKQSLEMVNRLENDETLRIALIQDILGALSKADFTLPPPKIKSILDKAVFLKTGKRDPYQAEKKRSNELILSFYQDLKGQVENSDDPFITALRLAIAGNIIDLGAFGSIDKKEIIQALITAQVQRLNHDNVERLRREIEEAKSILYIGDNSGEIVLDRLFIEQLPVEKITFAVRGKPCINDALMEDAETAGLIGLVDVIDSGTGIPGTVLEECSAAFVEKFNQADLIISKGQGNYETLNDSAKNIFYLFRVKCPVVARDSGVPLGEICLFRSKESI